MTLLDLIDGSLAERADHPALDDVSYAALDAGARRVAATLRARGIAEGSRLAIFSENRHGFVHAYLAALRLGAIVVPVNALYRAAELEHVITTASPSALVVSAQTRDYAEGLGVRLVDAGELEAVASDATAPALERRDDPAVLPGDIALIVFTSGTTGRSKGAMLTHANLAAIAAQLAAAWRWTAADTLAIALPLFHVHGLCAALNGTLATGARLLLSERFDARTMLETLARPEVTMFFGVPTMYVRLLEAAAERPGGNVALDLRLAVSGSAALSPDVHASARERLGIDILERYGATEFGFALGNRFAGPRVAGSVGVPFPGTLVRVVDPATQLDVAPGEIGELLVSGPNVCAGYWERPDATAEAFVLDAKGTRWYRSGDLARYDAGTRVYAIAGRIKELIVSGGFNIYPREIEIEFERLPGVRACAVVGVPDPVRGELPVAFIEADDTFELEAATAALRERLASFKIPRRIETVASLPRNALGKIEKPKLAAALHAESPTNSLRPNCFST